MERHSEDIPVKMTGRVLKMQNSFYEVETEAGLITAKCRGRLKRSKRETSVLTGDIVSLTRLADGTGVIEEALERKNILTRPPIANVDQVFVIFAAREPDISLRLTDRFLVLVELAGIEDIVLCINKSDLMTDEIRSELERYREIGYPLLFVCAETGEGMEALASHAVGKVSVLAGPSGVGKSSLMNRMMRASGSSMESEILHATGAVSEKIKRGRHTTRFSALLSFAGGYLADTPGFSATDFSGVDARDAARCFPEFRAHLERCRYPDCTHSHEPMCAVKEAVQEGIIYESRYDSYLQILKECMEGRKGFR
ncbi:ribosome small subunit-dependent GTPase A [Selenomonas sp. TAMA-11512]|uniref:ribosome small subunit-dependent GTPase A n=1 Tax=Selenomonas sp. TAMA-11512 TaxID=3095337 RepID=UPI00308E4CC6|nr:ribosome small subunit-dependent GTPase A [Selenomonas sp. TAMA-11512]